jgi:hypothetical protein
MLKTVLAIFSLATVVVVVSCGSNPSKSDAGACPPMLFLETNTPSCIRECDLSSIDAVNGKCPAGYKYFPVTCRSGDGGPANMCGDDAGSDAKSDAGDAKADVPAASGDAQDDTSYSCPPGTSFVFPNKIPSCYRQCDESTATPVNGKCPAGYEYFPVSCLYQGDGRPAPTCGHDAGDAQADVPVGS